MSRYFLMSDYIVFPQYKHEVGTFDIQVIPQIANYEERIKRILDEYGNFSSLSNKTLASITHRLEVKIVYFDYGIGNVLIKATGLQKAYKLARTVQAYLTIVCGVTPNEDRSSEFLIEVSRVPHYSWKENDLKNALVSTGYINKEFVIQTLYSGQGLFSYYFVDIEKYVKVIFHDAHISEAVAHLDQSYALFYGLMNSSFYHYHYARERPELTRYELEKDYLENKSRYELAFLAAFKAIEHLFGKSNIQKTKIPELFKTQPYKRIKFDSDWERFHEIFSSLQQHTNYGTMVEHFLDIRNVVAAHGNRKPPKNFLITQDNLYEIQKFTNHLIYEAVESHIT